MHSVPSNLHGHVIDKTHSVGTMTGVMSCKSSMC